MCKKFWLGFGSYYRNMANRNGQIWIGAWELTKYGYKILTKKRIGKKGGGIAIIYRSTLNVEWIEQQQNWEIFEIGIWSIKSKGITSYIHGIYRPPNSDLNQFLDEIAEYLALHINTKYPIFLRDFNIHWGDEIDGNASSFADTLEAQGLTQQFPVQFPTHNRNNILDLVISKAITKNFICDVLPGPYISDHLAVQVSIQMIREQQKREIIMYLDMKNKSAQNVSEKVNLRVEDFDHIDEIVEHLDKQIGRALNEVAPRWEKIAHIRKKQPWSNTIIKRQKTVMRNREQSRESMKHQTHGWLLMWRKEDITPC